MQMSSIQLNAVLYIKDPDNLPTKLRNCSKLLPVWLDYHKHLFDTGAVVLAKENREEQERIVNRIVPDWKIIEELPFSSSRYEEGTVNTYHLIISDTEFLIGTNKADVIHYCMTNRLERQNAILRGGIPLCLQNSFSPALRIHRPIPTLRTSLHPLSGIVPNNVIEFLDSVSFTDEQSADSFPIQFLGFANGNYIERIRKEIKLRGYIYYLDAFIYSDSVWGEDRVILSEDRNLLENTDFNADGHRVFKIERDYNAFLKGLIESKIEEITSRGIVPIDAGEYHLHVTDEEHTKIINAMPYKKTESPELNEFAVYFEKRVSDILNIPVKIFNDDIWIRICRPSSHSKNDYNPCHRDIYLDFYRNIVNIYVPIVGSNSKSTLAMQTGSHLWNERDIVVTRGGAYFPGSGKKYSVDAILQSRTHLDMTRPDPATDEFILFSPYLIHGCSSNENADITRMSIEIRFICDTERGREQEAEFRQFLEKRVWR
jgi:hypothetical protein